jgi:hypothetical protein
MLNKIPFLLRGVLAVIIGVAHALPILADWYWNWPIMILSGLVSGWLMAGLLYGVFAGKKAIEATPEHLRDHSRNQPDASSPADRAKGYWIMTFLFMAAGVLIPLAKTWLE